MTAHKQTTKGNDMNKLAILKARLATLQNAHFAAVASIDSLADIDGFYCEIEQTAKRMRNDILCKQIEGLQLKIDVVKINIALEETRVNGQSVLANFS